MSFLSLITPCYNEEANVAELHARVSAAMARVPDCTYEHIFIDNASTDETVARLKAISAADPRVKIIVNARNFGHIRSPAHALLQTRGEAVISLVADLQDPPEMIPELVAKWREGYKTVLCVKRSSAETPAMFLLRRAYYALVERMAAIRTVQNFTGFGLYDRTVVEAVRQMDDPYPFFRGQIAEIGLSLYKIPYDQPVRTRGITKNNFYTLYDIGMLGITNLSKVPLRLVTALGFVAATLSFLIGLAYLLYKLVFWASFTVGIAPLVIGLFFLGSVQLVSLGIIGEYVGAIHTQVMKRPLVIEKERIGF
ncbi:glycosyltransferase family 2 protein [Acidocella sp.]|uniref:glycosyltransferase family 2 protein n=1 Tax=Acidocella sp. TaxID=50710 RepID=UPI00262D060B|nr:glycosyltransferase family 2 protein [Acidocella sp.]